MRIKCSKTVQLGVLFSALSALTFSIMALFVKMANNNSVSACQQLMWRCIFQLFFAVTFNLVMRKPLVPEGFPKEKEISILWALQGIFNVISFLSYIGLTSVFTLGVGTTIFYTSPIYAGILGRFILGDPYGYIDLLLAGFTIGGLILTCIDEFGEMHFENGGAIATCVVLFFVSPLSYASASLVLRKFAHRVNTAHPLISTASIGIIVGLVGGFIIPSQRHIGFSHMSGEVWGSLVGIAAGNGGGFLFLHLALRHLAVGTVVLLTAIEVPLVFIIQAFIIVEPFTWKALVGAAIVLVACSLTSVFGSKREDETDTKEGENASADETITAETANKDGNVPNSIPISDEAGPVAVAELSINAAMSQHRLDNINTSQEELKFALNGSPDATIDHAALEQGSIVVIGGRASELIGSHLVSSSKPSSPSILPILHSFANISTERDIKFLDLDDADDCDRHTSPNTPQNITYEANQSFDNTQSSELYPNITFQLLTASTSDNHPESLIQPNIFGKQTVTPQHQGDEHEHAADEVHYSSLDGVASSDVFQTSTVNLNALAFRPRQSIHIQSDNDIPLQPISEEIIPINVFSVSSKKVD